MASGDPLATTVIIAQTVPKERGAIFETEQRELLSRVRKFPGFLGSELLAPQEGIQDEWVVVFRFDSPANLHAWLDSKERREVVDRLAPLLEEPARLQILAARQEGRTVAALFSHRVRPGSEDAYRAWRARIQGAQRRFDGFVDQESFDPVAGLSDEWVDVARFRSPETLEKWLRSEERRRLMDEVEPLLESLSMNRVATGLEGWFPVREGGSAIAPASWKQALTVLLALYPTVMLLVLFVYPLLRPLPVARISLVGNVMSVSLLTVIVMPLVRRVLGFWLFPAKASARVDVGVAAALVILVLAMCLGFDALDRALHPS